MVQKPMRAVVLKGFQQVGGVVYDLRRVPVERLRRRILQGWAHGTRVYEFEGAMVVLFPQVELLDCGSLRGFPLVKSGSGWTTAPVDHDAQPTGLGEVVHWYRGGVFLTLDCSTANEVDVSSWIDISGLRFLDAPEGLGLPPLPPAKVETPPVKEPHEVLGEYLAPSAEKKRFLEDLEAGFHKRQPQAGGGGSWASGLRGMFARWFGGAVRGGAGGGTGQSGGTQPSREPEAPGLLSVRLAQLAWQFYSLVGGRARSRQMQYLQQTLKLFEKEDLEEALRRALPLAGAQKAFGGVSLPQFFLWGLRKNLNLQMGQAATARSVLFGNSWAEHQDVYESLRRVYEKAFEKLRAQGKHREAAFVMAELLQDTLGAVSYLETIGERRLAAELAEARNAAPAVVVRQWFVAGERDRAMSVAQRTNCHLAAAELLEKDHVNEAILLRVMFARLLAEAGNYAAAAEATWNVSVHPELRRTWVEAAIGAGGETGARMLARVLELPEGGGYAAWASHIQQLLAPGGSHQARLRRAFMNGLLCAEKNDDVRHAARKLYRGLLRDYGSTMMELDVNDTGQLQRLLALSNDRVLATDAPRLSLLKSKPTEHTQDLFSRTQPLELTETESGNLPLYDAVQLAKGRFLAATGEPGVLLLDQDGRKLFRFDCPAHELVVSSTGGRCLALAYRGGYLRVSRIDIERRRVVSFGEVRLKTWQREFDGMNWFAARDNQVLHFDVHADELRILNESEPTPHPIAGLSGADGGEQVIAVTDVVIDAVPFLVTHSFSVPRLEAGARYTLRATEEQLSTLDQLSVTYLNRTNTACIFTRHEHNAEDGSSRVQLCQCDNYAVPFTTELNVVSGRCLPPHCNGRWIAAAVRTAEGVHISVLEFSPKFQNEVRVRILLAGATRASMRLQWDILTIADTAGRLYQYDLAGNRLTLGTRLLIS